MLISESEVGFLADKSVMADLGRYELDRLYQNRQHSANWQKENGKPAEASCSEKRQHSDQHMPSDTCENVAGKTTSDETIIEPSKSANNWSERGVKGFRKSSLLDILDVRFVSSTKDRYSNNAYESDATRRVHIDSLDKMSCAESLRMATTTSANNADYVEPLENTTIYNDENSGSLTTKGTLKQLFQLNHFKLSVVNGVNYHNHHDHYEALQILRNSDGGRSDLAQIENVTRGKDTCPDEKRWSPIVKVAADGSIRGQRRVCCSTIKMNHNYLQYPTRPSCGYGEQKIDNQQARGQNWHQCELHRVFNRQSQQQNGQQQQVVEGVRRNQERYGKTMIRGGNWQMRRMNDKKLVISRNQSKTTQQTGGEQLCCRRYYCCRCCCHCSCLSDSYDRCTGDCSQSSTSSNQMNESLINENNLNSSQQLDLENQAISLNSHSVSLETRKNLLAETRLEAISSDSGATRCFSEKSRNLSEKLYLVSATDLTGAVSAETNIQSASAAVSRSTSAIELPSELTCANKTTNEGLQATKLLNVDDKSNDGIAAVVSGNRSTQFAGTATTTTTTTTTTQAATATKTTIASILDRSNILTTCAKLQVNTTTTIVTTLERDKRKRRKKQRQNKRRRNKGSRQIYFTPHASNNIITGSIIADQSYRYQRFNRSLTRYSIPLESTVPRPLPLPLPVSFRSATNKTTLPKYPYQYSGIVSPTAAHLLYPIFNYTNYRPPRLDQNLKSVRRFTSLERPYFNCKQTTTFRTIAPFAPNRQYQTTNSSARWQPQSNGIYNSNVLINTRMTSTRDALAKRNSQQQYRRAEVELSPEPKRPLLGEGGLLTNKLAAISKLNDSAKQVSPQNAQARTIQMATSGGGGANSAMWTRYS